jgi:hypothetical protein
VNDLNHFENWSWKILHMRTRIRLLPLGKHLGDIMSPKYFPLPLIGWFESHSHFCIKITFFTTLHTLHNRMSENTKKLVFWMLKALWKGSKVAEHFLKTLDIDISLEVQAFSLVILVEIFLWVERLEKEVEIRIVLLNLIS